jgi:Fe-S cluster assembly protein SufD
VDQLHKAVVASPSGRTAFDGGVHVGRAAQRTDARQLSRSLLLAAGGRAHVKPSLQIVADDVRCTHGCTVAQLAGEELFYFAARGVDEAAAREALVYSFAAEVVEALPHPGLASRARGAIRAALQEATREHGSWRRPPNCGGSTLQPGSC